MHAEELKPNITVHGPLFPEPVQVIVAIPMGVSVKLVGKGTRSNSVYEPILTDATPIVECAAPAAPEPKRYYLNDAFALIAQYGSLAAAEAALMEAHDETQG